jgi:hypothetical protein
MFRLQGLRFWVWGLGFGVLGFMTQGVVPWTTARECVALEQPPPAVAPEC